jgi:hypothetical protein
MNHIQNSIEGYYNFHAVKHPDVGYIACIAWQSTSLQALLTGIYSNNQTQAKLALEILLSPACISVAAENISEAIIQLNDLIPNYILVDSEAEQQEVQNCLLDYYTECCGKDVFAPIPAHFRSRLEILSEIITQEERHNE